MSKCVNLLTPIFLPCKLFIFWQSYFYKNANQVFFISPKMLILLFLYFNCKFLKPCKFPKFLQISHFPHLTFIFMILMIWIFNFPDSIVVNLSFYMRFHFMLDFLIQISFRILSSSSHFHSAISYMSLLFFVSMKWQMH